MSNLTPYAILLLMEARKECIGEKFRLENNDAANSARRISDLGHQINDLETAIEILEKW